MSLEQLRYVRLGTGDLARATEFAQSILGLQIIDRSDAQVTFRSDFRDHTLVFVPGTGAQNAVGFEVRSKETLERYLSALTQRGLETGRGAEHEIAARKVKDFIWFRDHSGNRIELVLRPLNTGWRYFPARDAGIKGLASVWMRSTSFARDEALWTEVLGARISDWVGDAAFLRMDAAHHRVVLYPAKRSGILAVEYEVEGLDFVMRNSYVLQSRQIPIVHGPGRRPASNDLFLTFRGPDEMLYGFVAEGEQIPDDTARRPRQYPAGKAGLCAWGSECTVDEFQ